MMKESHHLLRGTLDLLILKSLSRGPKHGYDVLEWIENTTDSALQIMEGTIYPALHRMENRGWINSQWGTSKSNRRAKYYSLTTQGRQQLERETSLWRRYVEVMAKALASESESPA